MVLTSLDLFVTRALLECARHVTELNSLSRKFIGQFDDAKKSTNYSL